MRSTVRLSQSESERDETISPERAAFPRSSQRLASELRKTRQQASHVSRANPDISTWYNNLSYL
jgi:hypothetical protein